ncbi:MAG TPA: PAS domain S-box protein [Candidatus Kapabacteria bacterium]|nr:PAS domain S-box protein [Candidatus Kapabacteria bacterium]
MTLEPGEPSKGMEGAYAFSGGGEAWDIYRLLVENSYDLVGEIDSNGSYVYINPSYSRALGFPAEEILHKNAFEFIHPQDRDKAKRELKQQDGTTIIRFQHQNGSWKWFDCSFRQFSGPAGTRTVLISRDISARKEGEIKFEVLASLGSKLSAAKTQVDAARVIAEAAQNLCGWDAFSLDLYDPKADLIIPVLMIDELEGHKKEFAPDVKSRPPSPYVRTVLQNGPQRLLRKGNDFDNSLKAFGDIMHASASLLFVPIIEGGQPQGVVSIQSYRINAYSRSDLKLLQILAGHCAGTIARIRAMDSLSESQARFEAFMENTPGAAWIKDEQGHYIYANKSIEKIFQKPREEIINKSDTELLGPDGAKPFQKEDESVRESGKPLRIEKTMRPDDPRRWFICKFPFESSTVAGSLVGGLGFDITDQVQMQQSLRSSEERFRALFESAPVAIGLLRDGKILYTNPAYRRIFELPDEREIAGRRFLDDVSQGTRKQVESFFSRPESHQASLAPIEVRGLRSGEAEFPCMIQVAPVELPEGAAHLVFILDISEKRSLEEQLFQSQKMESIGRLAGGIAHDFANLLTVIRGYATRIEKGVTDPAPSLDGIIRAAQKATELTKQLLAFSRKQTVQIVDTDVNQALTSTARLLERVIGEDITLRLHLAPNLPFILADAGLLEQIVVNLGVTARESMPTGGNLTIRTSYLAAGERPELTNGWEKGAVSISIEDTGRGIPREDLPQIFEPFLKTQGGTDTALRLATVYGIVQQHSARIDIKSDIGLGTRFEILFPATAVPKKPRRADSREKAAEGTILIVEDSADLRHLVKDLLVDSGYQVMEAETYKAGLQLFESARDRITLIVADVCLEDGSGRELVRHIRKMKSGIKAILTTGYDPHQMRGKMDLTPDELFLPKPFEPEELLTAVETLLAGKG